MDQKFIIKGLGGKKKLKGSIAISGAKNAALKAMAATVLFDSAVVLKNIPNIEDTKRMADLLMEMGAHVEQRKNGEYVIGGHEKMTSVFPNAIAKRLRASIVLTGPILTRFHSVTFPHPGGCVIGERPIDLFLEGFTKMGAKISRKSGKYVIKAEKGLTGAELFFRKQSVTGTETFMMAGVLAKGKTVIKNAACEPEIQDLAAFLNASGARIEGAGTHTITITGGRLLKAKKPYVTMPDRIEAGSFLILGALCAQELEIKNCDPSHLESLLELFDRSGVAFEAKKNSVVVKNKKKNSTLRSVHITTHEYPGFPTDLQAPMTVFLTQVKGESQVFETIFEGRLNYVESLTRMGADITTMDPHRVLVKGPASLHGKNLESPDLRAGLAFIIAAAVARGESVIHNVYNVDRGYEHVEERLKKIGLDIVRVD